jgi:dihydrofolate synthase/folylpolyglutamate synthase
VHIAGTNGKGMTAAMVDRLLSDAGATVARYSSPHVFDLSERFLLGGRPLPAAALARAGHRVLDLADRYAAGARLAYFDVLTAIALLAYAEAAPDWVVLETGIGGRADATNVTPKALAIITRIGWDHMPVLGNTLEAIAGEKLGIARPGVPLVVAAQPPALAGWLTEQARTLGVPLIWSSTHALRREGASAPGLDACRVSVAQHGTAIGELCLPAPWGTRARLESAATALTAVGQLLGTADSAAQLHRARLSLTTPVPGRLDLRRAVGLAGRAGVLWPLAVLDGGHNADALAALGEQLTAWGLDSYTLIFGSRADKLVAQAQPPLARLFRGATRIVTLPPQGPRVPDAQTLAIWVRTFLADQGIPVPVQACASAEQALAAAAADGPSTLVVAGSFWMLGPVMARLGDARGAPLTL